MPNRKYSSNSEYRYGFNGQEKTLDLNETVYDFGERIYDPRLCKFLSIDKFTHKQPFYSPFSYAGNKPVWCIDQEGNQDVIITIYEKQKDGTLLQTAVCYTTITTIEDAKGIVRDPVHVNVVYEWGQITSSINPNTTSYQDVKKLVSANIDNTSGLNAEEKKKRDNPFEYYVEKVGLAVANLWGAVDLAKGTNDALYGYDREASGEFITEDRAIRYRLSGGVKVGTTIINAGTAAVANKIGVWGAWQAADLGVDALVERMGDWGLGEKGNNIIYSTLKSGKAFYDAITGKNLVSAIDLAAQLVETGLKGEALLNELGKRGVNMTGEFAIDKVDAVNKALEKNKEQYQTNGNPAQIK